MADASNESLPDRGNGPQIWRAPLRADEVHEAGRHIELTADAATMKALAKFANVNEVSALHAVFDVTRCGRDGLRVVGEVRARVGQTCIVSLEPMETEVVEPVDVVYEPPKPEPAVPARVAPAAPGALGSVSFEDEEDPPEPLLDGVADLGGLATEFLILGIDPYPRKPEATFDVPQDDAGESGPFAALAKLKYGDDGGK